MRKLNKWLEQTLAEMLVAYQAGDTNKTWKLMGYADALRFMLKALKE
jgi:hypothetical protein